MQHNNNEVNLCTCGWLGSPCSPSGSAHATSLPRQQTPSQQEVVRTPPVAKKSESPDLGGPMGLLQSLKLMVTESHRKATTTQRVESRNSSRVNSDDLPATATHGPKHGLYFGLMGAWYTHQPHSHMYISCQLLQLLPSHTTCTIVLLSCILLGRWERERENQSHHFKVSMSFVY